LQLWVAHGFTHTSDKLIEGSRSYGYTLTTIHAASTAHRQRVTRNGFNTAPLTTCSFVSHFHNSATNCLPPFPNTFSPTASLWYGSPTTHDTNWHVRPATGEVYAESTLGTVRSYPHKLRFIKKIRLRLEVDSTRGGFVLLSGTSPTSMRHIYRWVWRVDQIDLEWTAVLPPIYGYGDAKNGPREPEGND